jgi:hypothetical protein
LLKSFTERRTAASFLLAEQNKNMVSNKRMAAAVNQKSGC